MTRLFAGILALILVQPAAAQRPNGVVRVRTVAKLDHSVFGKMTVSPDARTAAYESDGGLYFLDLKTGKAWKAADGSFQDPDWSPGGDFLSFYRFDSEGNTDFIWIVPVDQKTQRVTGTARRVSVREGDVNAVSPDGKWIAYATYDDHAGGAKVQSLVVMPAKGGRERTIITKPHGIDAIQWSADGKWLYVSTSEPQGASPRPRYVTERILVSGGQSVPVHRSETTVVGPGIPGRWMIRQTPIAFAARRYEVLDAGGRVVATLPIPKLRETTGLDRGPFQSNILLTEHRTRLWDLIKIDFASGASRVLYQGVANASPLQSPVDSRIVFDASTRDRAQFAIANANGSQARTFSVSATPASRGSVLSPDGRHVAFRTNPGALRVLDLTTGKETAIDSATAIGQMRWVSNQALRYFRADKGKSAIAEASLAGKRRDVTQPVAFDGRSTLLFVDDTTFLRNSRGKLELLTVTNQVPRTVYTGDFSPGQVSPDGRFVILTIPQRVAPRYFGEQTFWVASADALVILDLSSGAKRVLELPFQTDGDQAAWPLWHPDGKHLVMLGHAPNSSELNLYTVPLDGDTPRAVAKVGQGNNRDRMTLTADGRSVLVSHHTRSETEIVEMTLPIKP